MTVSKLTKTGIGLRGPHVREVMDTLPSAGFLEVHAENYFSIGGIPFGQLMKLREHYPVSLHGVGLSLGSADGIQARHLDKLKSLVDAVTPVFVSEHISWSGLGGEFAPDLLPLPLTQESLSVIYTHVQRTQEALGRKILVENPSVYIALESEMSESDFISTLCRTTGCGLLLDVNNVHVSAHNLKLDPVAYITALPKGIVNEIHLAGYQDNNGIYVDAHNHPVHDPVWRLYELALARFGDTATLVEWDNDLPPLATLLAEAAKADILRQKIQKENHGRAA